MPDTSIQSTPPTLTKGTQGLTGFSMQALKDAGRTTITYVAEAAPAAVADAMLTTGESRDGGALTSLASRVIPSGKRLRIVSIAVAVDNTLGANPKRARLRLRMNTAGAVTTASPIQASITAAVTTAAGSTGPTTPVSFPDGLEYMGDGVKQFGFSLEFPDWVSAAQTGTVYVSVAAFEY